MFLVITVIYYLFISFCNSENLNVYTNEEKIALLKFRPLVADVLVRPEEKLDMFLIRWLRTKHLDLNKAATMLRNAQAFRKKYKLDTILNETIFYPNPIEYSIEGFDLIGNPIFTLRPTSIDLRAYMLKGLNDQVFRFCLQTVEKVSFERDNASRTFRKEINQIVGIVDVHGFNLRQHACLPCISLFVNLAIAFENYYPRLIRKVIAINVPRIATPLMELIRPLLSEYNNNILIVLSTNRKEWASVLNKIVDPDQLSYQYGGTRKSH